MFNERHSRDKIENFLEEMKADVILNNNPIIDKAWQEYRNLMRSEKILAYRHPKQVRTYNFKVTCQTLKCLTLGCVENIILFIS